MYPNNQNINDSINHVLPQLNSDTPKVMKSKWTYLEMFVKSELLFLVICFSVIYSPNFIFSLKPLPVFSQRNNQAQSQVNKPLNALDIVKLTNQIRNEENIPKLTVNSKLSKAAQKRAHDMISNNYFSHISPHGKYFTWWLQNEEYDYEWSGENLARDFTSSKAVVDAWVESQDHYKNLINPNYNEIGISVVRNPRDNKMIIVQIFGTEKVLTDELIEY